MSVRIAALSALAMLAPLSASAQGWILPPDGVRPVPGLAGPVVRTGSEIRVTIEGRIARFEVEEQFRNDGGRLAEGSYLYPLPGEAVFTDFSLFAGATELKGEMMDADQARGIYEEIVRRQLDPALITLAGHGLIRARVFPIQPGETRRIILRYSQVLSREGDALRLRHAYGTRGGDGAVTMSVRLPGSVEWGTPYSPTHQLAVSRDRSGTVVRIAGDAAGGLELFLPLRRGLVGTSILTHAIAGEEGFYMLLLAPPAEPDATVIPRDLTLVVDVSGSMSGEKMEQARAALQQALGGLRAADRFRVISFSSGVTRFRPGFVQATPAMLRAARQFIDDLVAGGGTNIEGAVRAVLEAPGGGTGRLGVAVFMTDGLPTVGEQSPEQLAALASGRLGGVRLFSIGVGHDVNTYLLDRLAVEGRGTAEYVSPGANVELAVGGILRRVSHPALTGLRIVEAPVTLRDGAPSVLPDLFFGEELVVMGRYRGVGRGTVVIEGERLGRRERITLQANFPAASDANAFIPPIWAARRIGELTRTLRIEGQSERLVAEIRNLGQRFGILTEYTSYLVQEPGVIIARDGRQAMPAPMAPSAQSGRAAFERAEASADMAATSNAVGMARRADREAAKIAASSGREVLRAGGHLFVKEGERWTDVNHRDTLQTVAVAPYSAAWFAVARALPELAEAMAASDQVTIAGRRASIRVSPEGATTLTASALARLVRDIRGS